MYGINPPTKENQMKRFMSKKLAILGTAVAVILGMGGAAFAYFTASANGSAAAQVGYASNWKFAVGAVTAGPLYPDSTIGTGNIENVAYTVQNVGKGNQNLQSLTVEVANSDGSKWSYQPNANEPACTAADFSIGGAAVGTPFVDTSAAGTYTPNETKNGSVTVQMIDNGLNQDNCQGLSVPLYFSTNPALSIDFGSSSHTVIHPANLTFTINAYQNLAENADGSYTFTFNNTYLSFVSAGDGSCSAVTAGANTTETCTLTDMSHSIKSDSFTFGSLQAGSTTINVTVAITGSGSVTQTFPVTIN
jgi:hypothetical protein